ncbi:hypothetical protein [Baboon cytomegalovirus]|nr:hypothetical protein [Baboon cytomegalovirus]
MRCSLRSALKAAVCCATACMMTMIAIFAAAIYSALSGDDILATISKPKALSKRIITKQPRATTPSRKPTVITVDVDEPTCAASDYETGESQDLTEVVIDSDGECATKGHNNTQEPRDTEDALTLTESETEIAQALADALATMLPKNLLNTRSQ